MPQIKEFYHDVDLKANQLFNSRLHNITTASRTTLGASLSTGDKGYMVYDTDTLKPYFWDGTQWQQTGGGAAVWGSITGTLTAQTDLINYLSTNYTPKSRTLTINGTTYDLSANRSWTVSGLPSQTGNDSKWLTTDGSVASWADLSGNISNFTNDAGYLNYVPTLQDVTTAGNITDKSIYVSNAVDGYISTSNGSWLAGIANDSTYSALVLGRYMTTGYAGYRFAKIKSSNITADRNYELPNASGTIPLTVNGYSANSTGAITIPVGAGTVTAVTASTPLASSGGTTPDISIQQASGSQPGYLSSTDWTTFNNKFSLPSLTLGSVLFSNGTTITENNTKFFWDNTNNRLGIGTSTPQYTLDINNDALINNVIIGKGSGSGNSTNTVVGETSLTVNTTGYWNTGLGYWSLKSNTSGYANTSIGNSALEANTTGKGNTAIGAYALYKNTTGGGTIEADYGSNTAIGTYALFNNTTGSGNIAIGQEALNLATTANNNVAIGTFAATRTTGAGNVMLGGFAGRSNTTGASNTILGSVANYNGSPNQSVVVGASASVNSATNSIAIGYNVTLSQSNSIQLGNSSITDIRTTGSLLLGSVSTFANSSALLELASTTKGFLPPRMTGTQANAISSKAEGLIVYVTDTTGGFSSKGLYEWDGTAWVSLSGGGSGSVTSVSAGTGMNFTAITTSGSVAIDTSKVPYYSTGFSTGLAKWDGSAWTFDTNTYLTSITSSDVTTALGYTPVTNARTLTINGVGYDLTADRSWTITAGVSSVGATSPITSSGGATPTISTSMSTNKLIGRYSSGTGVMEEISVGSGLTLTGAGVLNNTATPTATGYYGAWQDSVTQTAAAINTGYAMIFRTVDLENQVRVVTNGTNLTRITFDNTGIYNLQFSSQFQNVNNQLQDVSIWLRKNGTDVPGSTGYISVPNSHGGTPGHIITGWNYLLSVVAGEYYEIVWSTTSTDVTMQYYAAGSPPPSTASVIATVTQQAGIMAGTGISRGIYSVSTNTTAGSGANVDYVYLVSGTTTITLPTAVGNTNQYTIKRVGTNTVSIATTSSQTIDGSSSPITINTRYTSLTLISDGSNWNII